MTTLTRPAEAVLLVSFGGPEAPEEVMPFLRRVTVGKGVPDDRLALVAEHYYARGGVSPINAANRALRAALVAELRRRGIDLPVLWGNRNAAPFLADALLEARRRGLRRLRVVLTSIYPSYSGCRQYREDLAVALAQTGTADELELELLDFDWDHDAVVAAHTDAVIAALASPADGPGAGQPAELIFVAHSIPLTMAASAGPTGGEYVAALTTTAARVYRRLTDTVPGWLAGWRMAYCSRSGNPAQPWLEPDIEDELRALAAGDPRPVVVAPIGFISEHMEVVQDLDTAAATTAAGLGLPFARAATLDRHPGFVAALADRVQGPARTCHVGCCPNLRTPGAPAACGMDGRVQVF